MRRRIFEIIEVSTENDIVSRIYDIVMMFCIVISIVPMCFKRSNEYFDLIEMVTVIVFIIDYFLRLGTADLKLNKGKFSFIFYPFTFMALIDLISILPSLTMINRGLKVLKVFRLGRTFRVFRAFKVFKAFRYSKNIEIIVNVFKKQKDSLIIVGVLAFGYILVTALIMFNVEPNTFDTFFDAIYWATVSLTTVGYGDIYAVSNFGKVLTMISALVGIAIVALPAGIITAGYMDEIQKKGV